jgi:hypothetical protein
MPRGDLTDAVLRLDDDRDRCDQIPVDMMRDRQRRFSQKGRRARRLWSSRRAYPFDGFYGPWRDTCCRVKGP